MFLFKKKKRTSVISGADSISFDDMLQQRINLSVKIDGNDTLFRIFSQSKTNSVEFLFDKEQCAVLSEVLKDYVTNNSISKTTSILLENGE